MLMWWTRRRIVIAASAAGVVLVLGVVFGVLIPSLVRERASEAAARRGLTLRVGTVYVGLTEAVLSDLEVADRSSSALRVHVGEVRLNAGVFELFASGLASVSEIVVSDVDAALALDAADLPRVLERLRGHSQSADDARADRTILVERMQVALRDERGTLLSVADARVALEAGGRTVRLSAGPVELAPEERDRATAARATLRLNRDEEEGWKIAMLSVAGPEIRYVERDGSESSPLWARIRAHVRRLAPSTDEPRAPANAATEEGESEAGALLARTRAFLGPRLTNEAVLSMTNLSVVSRGQTGEHTMLRELEAEVRSLSEGRYLLSGSGRPGGGGRLGWRLTVHSEELWAEGNVDFQRVPFVLLVPILPSLPWYRPEDSRLSGELHIRGEGGARMHLEGEVTLDDLALSSRRIAPQPVRRISLSVAGDADWNPAFRRLDLSRGTLSIGDARVEIAGSLEWPEDHYLVDLRASLPPTECNSAVSGIPADLLAETSAFSFSGQIGARVDVRVDSRDLDATTLDIDVADGCLFHTAPGIADVTRFQSPFTHRVQEPNGAVFELSTGPGTAAWSRLDDISPFLIHAVLGHEDGGFFAHRGFATHAIRLALVRNLRAGRYVYGASTITMQLVKNIFLHREKTLARKVQEVLLTWWIESVMSKERILELYLNVIEYGPGIYGIRNAAQHYFGRNPGELGPAESAYLASILPNPKAYHSYWHDDSVPEHFRERVARFLRVLGDRGRYDREAVQHGLEQLAHFDFHHPGDAPPSPPVVRGGTALMPFGSDLDRAWDEAIPPDEVELEEEPEEELDDDRG